MISGQVLRKVELVLLSDSILLSEYIGKDQNTRTKILLDHIPLKFLRFNTARTHRRPIPSSLFMTMCYVVGPNVLVLEAMEFNKGGWNGFLSEYWTDSGLHAFHFPDICSLNALEQRVNQLQLQNRIDGTRWLRSL